MDIRTTGLRVAFWVLPVWLLDICHLRAGRRLPFLCRKYLCCRGASCFCRFRLPCGNPCALSFWGLPRACHRGLGACAWGLQGDATVAQCALAVKYVKQISACC